MHNATQKPCSDVQDEMVLSYIFQVLSKMHYLEDIGCSIYFKGDLPFFI